jgi:hypothetical protein
MVLAAKLGLHSVQCDTTAAFIHGFIPPEEEINAHQPRGFKQGNGTSPSPPANSLWALPITTIFYKYFTERLVKQ